VTSDVILRAGGVRKEVVDGERRTAILDDIHLAVRPGESVALVGPSGSGKSTLLHILGALDNAYKGSVTIGAQALERLSDKQRARLRNQSIGFVFQSYNLLAHLSARENVLLPAQFSGSPPDGERALAILEKVGLADKAARKPALLSGGERQRVAIARALYNHPRIILCDEPTGNLDGQTGKDILRLFENLRADGATFLIATHDDQVADFSDRVLRISEGRLR